MGIFRKDPSLENSPPTYDEAYLLDYLAHLKKEDIERLAALAQGTNPNDSTEQSQSMTDYYNLLRQVFGNNFNSTGNTPHTRNQRYEIYDEMDESTAYISSALDILSDDATQVDSNGVIIHVESESSKVVTLVNQFLVEYELEDKVSKWARAVAKYGDLFIKVEGDYNKGITYINDTLYPSLIDRKDLNGKLLAFADNQQTLSTTDNLYAPWEFVHFRHKGDIYREESHEARLGLGNDRLEKSLTSAYGQSILRPAIKTYAQLRFVENMILLSRLTNSIRRNIFSINVGDIAPDKAFETIANYANLLKKDVNFNIEDSIYSSGKHTIKYNEDIFIPVNDPKNDIRIDQVGGDADVKEQYDLEYLLNKLFSALKVPKAYLNYEQDLNARSTLVQLDIRYARSVGQLQNTIESGLMRLVKIHLAYLGLNPEELDLNIYLTPVSAIDEDARTEQLQKQVDVADRLWNLLGQMNDTLQQSENPQSMNMQVAMEDIMSNYLELDKDTINKIFNRETEEEESSVPIRSHRVYRNSDLHEMYPIREDVEEYKSLKESLLQEHNSEECGHE